MRVVILCGGQGIRLWPYTRRIPKPLIRIGGKPILHHVMKAYERFGYRDFILCLGYKGDQIRKYFEENPEGWNIHYVDTGLESPTGERIRRIASAVDGEAFFATYADGVANVDLEELLRYHRGRGRIATITVVRPFSPFGVVTIGEGGEVVSFQEKPLMQDWINGGFFVFSREVFDHIRSGEVLEREVFGRLAALGQLSAYRHSGFWRCMDTYKDAIDLNDLAKAPEAPWDLLPNQSGRAEVVA
jgi:glucose-1-phosphate cytidylyltransferase